MELFLVVVVVGLAALYVVLRRREQPTDYVGSYSPTAVANLRNYYRSPCCDCEERACPDRVVGTKLDPNLGQ